MQDLGKIVQSNWIVLGWIGITSWIVYFFWFGHQAAAVPWGREKMLSGLLLYWQISRWYWVQLILSLLLADLILFGWWQSEKNYRIRFFLEWALAGGVFVYWGINYNYTIFFYAALILLIGIYLKMQWVLRHRAP